MEGLGISNGTLASVVIALSFAAGLNVYATVFALGLMARLHWVVLPGGLEALANIWILVVSGIMFAGEFVADKIPGFDLMWNAMHTFVRIPVAALLAYSASSHLSPEMQLLVTCAGAALATLAHGSKNAVRLAITPSPEPISNIALSTGEDAVALGLTWLATHHPLWAGGVATALSVGAIVALVLGIKLVRKAVRGLFGRADDGSGAAIATTEQSRG
jgi:hypothetical protein